MLDYCNLLPHLKKSNQATFSPELDYVYQLNLSPTESDIIASGSNKTIKVYSSENLDLICQIKCNEGQISEIGHYDENVIISSTLSGVISFHDKRNGETVIKAKDVKRRSFLSCSWNNRNIAVGTDFKGEDASLLIWDVRNMKVESNSLSDHFGDDITSVKFNPMLSNMLCTGSTDGLCCIFDLNQISNEDEGLISVFNSESTVSKIGFFGQNFEFLFLQTHIETLSLWSLESMSKIIEHDVRGLSEGKINYLANCFYTTDDQRLYLCAGSAEELHLLHVNAHSIQLCQSINLESNTIIRSGVWSNKTKSLYTGGEDSKIIYWSPRQSELRLGFAKKQQNKFRPY